MVVLAGWFPQTPSSVLGIELRTLQALHHQLLSWVLKWFLRHKSVIKNQKNSGKTRQKQSRILCTACFCKRSSIGTLARLICLQVCSCSQTPGTGLRICEAHQYQSSYHVTLRRNVCCDLISAMKTTDTRRFLATTGVGRSRPAGFC